MFECFDCSRRFRKVQALRGHLRHCEYHRRHRLKQQAEAEAGNQPAEHNQPENQPSRGPARPPLIRGDGNRPLSRRPGRDSQDSLLLLLDVYEILPKLKNECLDYVAISRQLASVRSNITSSEEWVKVYWILDECERDYEQMVFRFRLDPVLLFRIYRTMLAMKERWLCYLAQDWSKAIRLGSGIGEDPAPDEVHDKYVCALREEELRWDTILTKVKKMLVGSC